MECSQREYHPTRRQQYPIEADLDSQGLTTAAQKINRKGILQKYQKDVDRVYGGGT